MSGHRAADVGRPRVSWHRGGAELVPYATLAAFAAAAARSAELIEVDVRRTADGVIVCVHDAEVPGLGTVGELRWSDPAVRRAAGARVFEFTEFLDVLDEHDPTRASEIHLDVKESGLESDAVGQVLARDRPLVVTSADDDVVRSVRRSHPHVPALLTLGRDARGLSRGELLRARVGELLPWSRIEGAGATGVAAHFLLAGRVLREWCTRRGMQLLVWTVDSDRALTKWLKATDVDVVTTNRPLAAMALRDELASRKEILSRDDVALRSEGGTA